MDTSQMTGDQPRLIPQRNIPANGWREGIRIWLLRALVVCGFVALLYYFGWWFEDERILSPWLALIFLCAMVYGGAQLAGNWLLYLAARRPAEPPAPPKGLKVDVFVTACGEDYAMIEQTLRAASEMRGEHRTWLLDDGADPVLRALAKRLGVGYLTRVDRKDAKAGNLNAALPRTEGEVIAVFDVDHAPAPDFLERSLGLFNDPQVGFVQVMLTFGNSKESWVAQAAMETSLEFYNPTSLGTDGVGGATMMGSNALIRRKALESIGGYQPGLAEDLATSIALHAAGWRSAYVAEPLAPGLAPPSFTAWFIQQMKWARGVFELLLTVYPRLFGKLTGGQRLSYAVRMTKYWIGPVVGLHLFATVGVLIFSEAPFRAAFHEYLVRIFPLVACDVLIRYRALRDFRHPCTPRTSLAKAVTLVYATWPIYLMAWLMAVLRLPLGFRPTPKNKSGNLNPIWLLPQLLALLLLTAGMLYTVLVGGHRPSLLLVVAILQGALQLFLLAEWMKAEVRFAGRISRSLVALREISRPAWINRRVIKAHYRGYLGDVQAALDRLPIEVLEEVITALHQARLSNRKVFILGNSSSAWIARHLARGLISSSAKAGWPAFRVCEVVGNDVLIAQEAGKAGHERIPLHQLPTRVSPGDIVIAFFTLVYSRNLVQALKSAQERQAKTIAISSLESSKPEQRAELHLRVQSDYENQVEDSLLMVARLICKVLEEVTPGREAVQIKASLSKAGEAGLGSESSPMSGSPELARLAAISQGSLSPGFLYELGRTPELQVDREQLLRRVLQISLESLGAASGSLLLFDELGQVSQAVVAYAGKVESYSALSMADTIRKGLAGWVIEHQQPALVMDTNMDERWLRRPWDEINGSRSAISVPLMDEDRVAGVLTLVQPEPGRFTQGDVVLLTSIAVSLTLFSATSSTTQGDATFYETGS